jgi:hypothetical protein
VTVHIQGPGHLLCGPRNDPPKGDWVYTMAPAERFRSVTCVLCLREQAARCRARLNADAEDTGVGCELATLIVCSEALSALMAREAS